MKALLTSAALCLAGSVPAAARDYGQHGTLWPVIEPDLLTQIEARLTHLEKTGETARLNEQLKHLNPSSPDRTHGHILREGEGLHRVADEYYRQPEEWRRIALANGIEDPRRLTIGARLRVPRIPPNGARI